MVQKREPDEKILFGKTAQIVGVFKKSFGVFAESFQYTMAPFLS